MHWIDWSIILGLQLLLVIAAVFTKKYTKSVADFLVANRCVGRYLLSISQGMAGLGAISVIGGFEMYYNAGFTAVWWQLITVVTTTAMLLSGWFFYRFRQTRALTLAQFLEIRYSKRFRIFAGLVAWVSGIVNFGIFPSVGARFFIYFCGFPDSMAVYALVMVVLLAFALLFTFLGGQIAVIVTDFIQGTFCNIMFVIIFIVVLSMVSWSQITEALSTAPVDASLIHPFHTQGTEAFDVWYYLIFAFVMLYTCGIWQGSQAYNASALNAHEARMGKILGTWRILTQNFLMMILPICVYVFIRHSDFSSLAANVEGTIAGIENPQIQKQMTTPIALRAFFPTGIVGGFVAVMLAAFISTHDTYLHSWGSIFIQDVVIPFRKKPLTPKLHMFLLRSSIFGVAVFIFLFSLVFRQTEYILMFFMITGAIFTGGAGAAVFGGLYWKRGTTTAAWSAMITGSALAVVAVIVRQVHQSIPFTGKIMGYIASQNGAVLSFYASVIAILVYILVSLMGRAKTFNMDKMLHRGAYAVEEPGVAADNPQVRGLQALIGITSEFNLRDKILYLATVGWTVLWIVIFIAGTIYNLAVDIETTAWMTFWRYYIWMTLALSIIVTIWFILGGIRDLKRMFFLLSTVKRNDLDDGMVVDHQNPGEASEDVSEVNSG